PAPRAGSSPTTTASRRSARRSTPCAEPLALRLTTGPDGPAPPGPAPVPAMPYRERVRQRRRSGGSRAHRSSSGQRTSVGGGRSPRGRDLRPHHHRGAADRGAERDGAGPRGRRGRGRARREDRKSTRLNSSHVSISYAVFCLKKKTTEGTRTK